MGSDRDSSGKISTGMVNYILANFNPCTILELGSGGGSQILIRSGFKVMAVEHSDSWVNRFDNVEYFHAPLVKHKPVKGFDHYLWYDKRVIRTIPHTYQLMIIDGPPGCEGRSGFLKYFDLFPSHDLSVQASITRSGLLTLAETLTAIFISFCL